MRFVKVFEAMCMFRSLICVGLTEDSGLSEACSALLSTLIGQRRSCAPKRPVFWSTPLLNYSRAVSSVWLTSSQYLFLVGSVSFHLNNQQILRLSIVLSHRVWTRCYLIGVWSQSEEAWQSARLLWREFDESKLVRHHQRELLSGFGRDYETVCVFESCLDRGFKPMLSRRNRKNNDIK